MSNSQTVSPLASAVHHQAAAQFWESRSHLLQNALLESAQATAGLTETIKQRDEVIARLDQALEAFKTPPA